MKRFDLGVFEPADLTPDGSLIGDLVSLATLLGPELHRPDSGERAAVEIEQWAESDPALLEEAETIAHREHHEDAAKILQRAHDLATV